MGRVLFQRKTENLSCELTHEQWLERVRERSAVETEIETRLRAISDMKHRHKEELSKLEKELMDTQGRERTLGAAVRLHQEIRPVDVELLADIFEKKMVTVRLDTGAEVYRRDLTEAELQKAQQQELSFGATVWTGSSEGVERVTLQDPASGKEVEVKLPSRRSSKAARGAGEPGRKDTLPAAADVRAKPKRGPKAETKAAVEGALDGASEA